MLAMTTAPSSPENISQRNSFSEIPLPQTAISQEIEIQSFFALQWAVSGRTAPICRAAFLSGVAMVIVNKRHPPPLLPHENTDASVRMITLPDLIWCIPVSSRQPNSAWPTSNRTQLHWRVAGASGTAELFLTLATQCGQCINLKSPSSKTQSRWPSHLTSPRRVPLQEEEEKCCQTCPKINILADISPFLLASEFRQTSFSKLTIETKVPRTALGKRGSFSVSLKSEQQLCWWNS